MGRRRGSTAEKTVKKKAVTRQLIKREHSGQVTMPYRMLDLLISESRHEHLKDARIALVWNLATPKEDADGRVVIYSVAKFGDLHRTLLEEKGDGCDLAIIINHEIWNKKFKDSEMMAMLDEALCRFAVVKDKNGEPKLDDKDRLCFRLCKPDVVTFRQNIAHHGLWRPEISKLIETAAEFNDRQRPLLNSDKKPGSRFSESAFKNGEANGHAEANGHTNGAANGKKKTAKKSKLDQLVERAEYLRTETDITKAVTSEEAYDAGKNCQDADGNLSDCPHDKKGGEQDDWLRGFMFGQTLAKTD